MHKKLRVGTDCSGIEAPIQALLRLNWSFVHLFSSDIDPYCRQVISNNYHVKKIYKDITKRDHMLLPPLDLYVAGFPCQSFTGLRKDAKGLNDSRGTIFFECLKTIKATRPKCFLLENVSGLLTHDNGNTFMVILDSLHKLRKYYIYHTLLNSKDYGLPQNRPRVYIIGVQKCIKNSKCFHFPDPIPLTTKVSDLMDKKLRVQTTLTPNMIEVVKNRVQRKHGKPKDNYIVNVGVGVNGFGSAMKDISPCLMANAHRYYSTKFKRFLTGREYLRLQGFPDSFKTLSDDRITKKQAGNSMSVSVIQAILQQLEKFLF